MSNEALNWAFSVKTKATDKYVLVALADFADENDLAYPSTETLVNKTCLDRKTVLKSLAKLEAGGFIIDTKTRKGQTRQIKVFKLSQIRNSTENGTVPNFPDKSPIFPSEESQISQERVPNLGYRTTSEPSEEPLEEPPPKKIENYTDEFLEFWKAYPPNTRSSKKKSFANFKTALKETDHETIIRSAAAYSRACATGHQDLRYVPAAERWLNNNRWEADYDSRYANPNAKVSLATAARNLVKDNGFEFDN